MTSGIPYLTQGIENHVVELGYGRECDRKTELACGRRSERDHAPWATHGLRKSVFLGIG